MGSWRDLWRKVTPWGDVIWNEKRSKGRRREGGACVCRKWRRRKRRRRRRRGLRMSEVEEEEKMEGCFTPHAYR